MARRAPRAQSALRDQMRAVDGIYSSSKPVAGVTQLYTVRARFGPVGTRKAPPGPPACLKADIAEVGVQSPDTDMTLLIDILLSLTRDGLEP
jgi:hypothetical protein